MVKKSIPNSCSILSIYIVLQLMFYSCILRYSTSFYIQYLKMIKERLQILIKVSTIFYVACSRTQNNTHFHTLINKGLNDIVRFAFPINTLLSLCAYYICYRVFQTMILTRIYFPFKNATSKMCGFMQTYYCRHENIHTY